MQGKTQVFPGHEGDFFRNRLTHSLEVAQIAKSIAIRLNATSSFFKDQNHKIDVDLVEFAGLAHDLGHPPFGHNGEKALDDCMLQFGGFEGNAQTLRIISRLEKKTVQSTISPLFSNGRDKRVGLNLTYRSLAAILKYDKQIPKKRKAHLNKGVTKGYYAEEVSLIKKIKKAVLSENVTGKFKSIECSIMDIADDIAYSTYDLEDVFKSGVLSALDLFALDPTIYDTVAETINKRLKQQYRKSTTRVDRALVQVILQSIFSEIFEMDNDHKMILESNSIEPEMKKMYFSIDAQERSKKLASVGYERTRLTSNLVQSFLNGIEVVPHVKHPALHQAKLDEDTFIMVEVLKNITYEAVIRAPALQVVEFRGKGIITQIFEAIIEPGGDRLLPEDFKIVFRNSNKQGKHRTVCDFIAGMTDRYAVEFYGRLFGAQGITMHKPL